MLLNYLAPLRVLREALTTLNQGGFVLNISAVVADKPMPNMGAYSASKAAVTALLKSVRTEARKSKIRIVDVRPPHTETGLATRPIAGQAPKLPQGLTPEAVAARIVAAIVDDETKKLLATAHCTACALSRLAAAFTANLEISNAAADGVLPDARSACTRRAV